MRPTIAGSTRAAPAASATVIPRTEREVTGSLLAVAPVIASQRARSEREGVAQSAGRAGAAQAVACDYPPSGKSHADVFVTRALAAARLVTASAAPG